MATPEACTYVFKGRSGRTWVIDGYISDVAAAASTFDSGAGTASSTSDAFYIIPEDCILRDFIMTTGTTAAVAVQVVRNSVPTGNTLRFTAHLTSLNNRPVLEIPFKAGDKFTAIQR